MRDRDGKKLPKVKSVKTLDSWREVEEPEEMPEDYINPKYKIQYDEYGNMIYDDGGNW